ncbi:hypothetical protein CEW83_01585 [Parazoarcus communis]|uniref:Uncharacterized protein n=1 Tax=Parazoarcus communis TaxID=41977 RepID=A0A2U8GKU7_9RHOO|nr:hypothetical protein [Parazoarcus communis]AWI74074.1 hypothetical protein CEW83_01585 [Parazoarcus communis]
MTKKWIGGGESGPALVASGTRASSAAPFSILDGLSPPPRVSACEARWRVLPGAARGLLALVLLALAFWLGMIYVVSGDEGTRLPDEGAAAADRVVSAVAGDDCRTTVPAGAARIAGATAACAPAATCDPQSPVVDGGVATIRALPVTPAVDDTRLPGASAVSGLKAAAATENGSAAKRARQGAEQKRSAGKKAEKKTDKKAVAGARASRRDHDVDIIVAIVEATRPAR